MNIMIPNFPELLAKYAEPFRHYHGQHHINTLLDLFNTREEVQRLSYEDSTKLFLAIWYHDAIYNIPAGAESNEVLSAQYFRKHNLAQHDSTVDAILATEFHFSNTEYDDPVVNLMLDFDIFTFSYPYEEYKRINLTIDAEYECFFSAGEVFEKRLAFLQTILDQRSLRFRALDDRAQLEVQAYANIERYISDRRNNG